jgi:hypothetical protein
MASLFSQNIGLNYKGILNLNTLNGNLTTTLQAVTDGDGNASPLQLSTTEVAVSGNSATNAATTSYFIYDASANPNARNYAISVSALAYGDLNFMRSNTLGGAPLSGTSVGKFDFNGNFSVGIGTTAASARLHVRGDGTNPIARFESNDGSINWRFSAGGFGLENSYQAGIYGAAISGDYSFAASSYNNLESTVAFQGIANINGTIAVPSSGTGTKHILAVNYTINNSGAQTGTATGIFLNATETALNGMGHNLLDLQRGGVSQFSVDRVGSLTTTGRIVAINSSLSRFLSIGLGNNFQTNFSSTTDGVLLLTDGGGSSFNRIQLGGTTNAFPAIKRNSAAIDFRLADDSGFCGINSLSYAFGDANISITQAALGCILMTLSPQFANNSGLRVRTNSNFNTDASANAFSVEANLTKTFSVTQTNQVLIGSGTVNASAILQADSTTRGFLPPRMTTTERDLIATPAAGLMIYNTTTNRPNFYDGSAWVAL